MHERHGAHPMREVCVRGEGVALDFDAACDLTKRAAGGGVMFLAWFDRKVGKAYSEVSECMHRPGWIAYTESRSADLKVIVNDGERVILFFPVEEG